ncbi:transporter substrate-binding domain-containing protein [Aerococcaceae bacterium DSM 111022]|nr:transporter substrate-binding domain-containing protein [Aerococcaceae bacterium DSM 111022]
MKKTFTKLALSLLSATLVASFGTPFVSAQETISVAVENNSQPLSFTDNTGELVGYEIDVLNAIDEQLEDYDFNIEAVSAEATQVGLDAGRYSFIGGGLFKTPEREELYAFPEENTGASIIRIYKRADDDSIATLDDLSGKVVHPVTPNGGIFNLLTQYNEENPDNQIEIQLGESGSYAQRYQDLHEGVADAVVLPSNLGQDVIIDQLELNVAPVEEPVRVNGTYFVFAQGQDDLIAAFDEAVAALKEDGTLEEIANEWYGENVFEYELTED